MLHLLDLIKMMLLNLLIWLPYRNSRIFLVTIHLKVVLQDLQNIKRMVYMDWYITWLWKETWIMMRWSMKAELTQEADVIKNVSCYLPHYHITHKIYRKMQGQINKIFLKYQLRLDILKDLLLPKKKCTKLTVFWIAKISFSNFEQTLIFLNSLKIVLYYYNSFLLNFVLDIQIQ